MLTDYEKSVVAKQARRKRFPVSTDRFRDWLRSRVDRADVGSLSFHARRTMTAHAAVVAPVVNRTARIGAAYRSAIRSAAPRRARGFFNDRARRSLGLP